MGTISSLYNPCPDCSCGRNDYFQKDPLGKKYQALKFVRQDLERILRLIPLIENPEHFLKVRQELFIKYDVDILVWSDATLQIKNTPALCKRTRKKLQEVLNRVSRNIIQNIVDGEVENHTQERE